MYVLAHNTNKLVVFLTALSAQAGYIVTVKS